MDEDLGIYRAAGHVTPIVDNQMEHEMETRIILGFIGRILA